MDIHHTTRNVMILTLNLHTTCPTSTSKIGRPNWGLPKNKKPHLQVNMCIQSVHILLHHAAYIHRGCQNNCGKIVNDIHELSYGQILLPPTGDA